MIFNQTAVGKLKVGGYVNQEFEFLATDTLTHCFNRKLFASYPYDISYKFNELGFREVHAEQYTQDAIICIGDSFTVGVGLPVNLTYPKKLQEYLNYPVLNFGLNGASNEWIARKLENILEYFTPRAIIVHYTFSHRRERNEPNWFDDERTLCEPMFTEEENYNNWLMSHNRIVSLTCDTPVIYSFIPNWHTSQIDYNIDTLVNFKQVDYARDWFHYGQLTSDTLAKMCAEYISRL